jgi:heme exporter protein D
MGDIVFFIWLAMGILIVVWGVMKRIKKKKEKEDK